MESSWLSNIQLKPCRYLFKQNPETNSVFCNKLDQWVSTNYCRCCPSRINDNPKNFMPCGNNGCEHFYNGGCGRTVKRWLSCKHWREPKYES